jgi:hypothetical protein
MWPGSGSIRQEESNAMKTLIYALTVCQHGTKSLAHAFAQTNMEGGHEVIGNRTQGSSCDVTDELQVALLKSNYTIPVNIPRTQGNHAIAELLLNFVPEHLNPPNCQGVRQSHIAILREASERYISDNIPFFDMNGFVGLLWPIVFQLPYEIRGIHLTRDPRTYVPASVSGDLGGGLNYGHPDNLYNIPGEFFPLAYQGNDRQVAIKRTSYWWKLIHEYFLLGNCPRFRVEDFNLPETAQAILNTVYPEHSPEELDKFTSKLCSRKDHDGPVIYQEDGYPIKGGEWEKGIAAKPFYQWNKDEQNIVYRICGETMEKLGYQLDDPYFQA